MVSTAIVIGGGTIGLCSALSLARKGIAVTVIEPDADRRAASWGNAGHVAIEQTAPLASWETIRSAPRRHFLAGGALDLPIRGIARWLPFSLAMIRVAGRVEAGQKALSGLLAAAMPAWRALGLPGLLDETGHYVLWESAASAATGLAAWRHTDTGTARFRPIDAREQALFEGLLARPPAGGIRFENTGQIADPVKLADALEAALSAAGGRIRRARASALTIESGMARVLIEGGEALDADHILVAAGVRSRELMASIGIAAPLIAERGYHIQSDGSGWPDLPPVVFEDRSMILTRFASGLRAASFVEFGDPDSPADPRKWARLHAHAEALGLPIGADAVRWMGARPTLPDYLPAIGRSARASNLLYAFGHQHLGLTLAPLTGELVAALATGAPPALDLSPFTIARFAKGGRTA